MKYEEALEYISQTNKFGIRLGLENIGKLLELLGNPQETLNIIHVAGTNGKGSVCSFISNILRESGYKVGLYTSPYLETFTERIRVNGENIPQEDVARIIDLIKEKIEVMVSQGYAYPTEFEVVTAMAFYYYSEQKVDFVALEVGLGGRYDATNIITKSLVSVITSISLDHTGILGDTIEKIAYEKAGIIKENGVVLVYDQTDEAKDVIKSVCKEKNAKYIEVNFDNINIKKSNINFQVYDCNVMGETYKNLEITLIGEHQINNSILAMSVLKYLKDTKKLDNVSEESIREGLITTKWPGRIEKIKESPIFIIDGAHNEDGAKSLAKALDKHFKDKKLTLLIGMLEDKDIDGVLDILMPKFSKVVTTTPNNPRAINSDILKEKILKYVSDVTSKYEIEDAVNYTLETSNKDDIIISAGSLYMIGTVRTLVKKL
ncbi:MULTISPECIES: bifunctional folylpolyglutamate synthase/dihydrofolate synthase [unclassified Clostridioides]|uniref:bifunctional folylpolyglutamate synthase/dihydrofolate synthase n=1 Tax=unclassified Clostridioides TaxID=2635829 RepID=UPI001D127FAC|nr:bifunctional folylpolyglutamate synthase/dihydrofolate synthase [Clostridioides sp. ZZV14-6150]MCC0669432.1 bifunctional folylpolyglutamate synthase/dihydrofolate synthase [Clostridioides sp. ZZV14-6153]MCC0720592.1 bifunctional folylpolyglutamate synthase/dihydrofolate synthase [Clostridioides sp. ZZV14-6105]MCC0723818.1 bifunctional folylpolyglutamate synthase/dihydrofolate synthase [Clostridioides sp. ZZV14-6104]MCC0726668.1 bifunctional folylpolyglutamate synthase/dihydrofolate synthase 